MSPAFKLGECYLKYRASSNKRKLGVRELILWRSREFSIIRLEIKVETLLSASVGLLSFSKAKCRFTMYCTFSQLWKCCPIALLVGLVCSESRVCKRLSVFPIYVAEQPGHVTSLFVYSIFNKYKTFSVLIYSYINTSGNWENEKLCGNTISSFPNFNECWYWTVYQYGKNVLYLLNIEYTNNEVTCPGCSATYFGIELYQHGS